MAIKKAESVIQADLAHIPNWEYDGESVILPIDEDPPARNLLRHAIPLSVIGATRRDKAEMIVLNNYIDVVFRPWYHFFDYDNHLYLSWPELICNRIMGDFFRALNINIADCVISGLKAGYYSDLWLDAYYIPGKGMYQEMHLAHNVLMIKNNPEAMVDYNDDHITDKLKRYIESRYELADNTKENRFDNNQSCNYNACLEFSEYMKATAEKEGRIYTVALYGFLEHKKLMGWRLEYIAKMREWDLAEFSQYKTYTEEITERIMLLGLKFQYSGKIDIINRMASMMDELLAKEKDVILKIVYGM